jgi:hypothetical protein
MGWNPSAEGFLESRARCPWELSNRTRRLLDMPSRVHATTLVTRAPDFGPPEPRVTARRNARPRIPPWHRIRSTDTVHGLAQLTEVNHARQPIDPTPQRFA